MTICLFSTNKQPLRDAAAVFFFGFACQETNWYTVKAT